MCPSGEAGFHILLNTLTDGARMAYEPPSARFAQPQPLALSSRARHSYSVDALDGGLRYNREHPPANTRTGVESCPTPGTGGRVRLSTGSSRCSDTSAAPNAVLYFSLKFAG